MAQVDKRKLAIFITATQTVCTYKTLIDSYVILIQNILKRKHMLQNILHISGIIDLLIKKLP